MNPELLQLSREELEVRLTALLLGELPPAEAGAMLDLVARDRELAALVARLEQTIGYVREAVKTPAEPPASAPGAPKLAPAAREKLLQHLRLPTPAQLGVLALAPRTRRFRWLVPASAAAILLLGVAAFLLHPYWAPVTNSLSSEERPFAWHSRSAPESAAVENFGAVANETVAPPPADRPAYMRRFYQLREPQSAQPSGDIPEAKVPQVAALPAETPVATAGNTLTVTAPNPSREPVQTPIYLGQNATPGVNGNGLLFDGDAANRGSLSSVGRGDSAAESAPSAGFAFGGGYGGGGGVGGGGMGGFAGGRTRLGLEAADGRASAQPESEALRVEVRPQSPAPGVVPATPPPVQLGAAVVANNSVDFNKSEAPVVAPPADTSVNFAVSKATAALASTEAAPATPTSGPTAGQVSQSYLRRYGLLPGAAPSTPPPSPAKPAAEPAATTPPIAAEQLTELSTLSANGKVATVAGKAVEHSIELKPASNSEQFKAALDEGKAKADSRLAGANSLVPSRTAGRADTGLSEAVAEVAQPAQLAQNKIAGAYQIAATTNAVNLGWLESGRYDRAQQPAAAFDWYFDRSGTAAADTSLRAGLAAAGRDQAAESGEGETVRKRARVESSARGVYLPMPSLKGTPEDLPSGPNIEPIEKTEREQRDAWGVIAAGVRGYSAEPPPASVISPQARGKEVPQLGDLPVLGELFRAPAKLKNQESAKKTSKVDELAQGVESGDRQRAVASEPPPPARPAASANAPIPQPEIQTAENPFSTFSLNISDVSYKLAQASLEKGVMPDAASIRSEEFINAFDYRDPEAAPGVPIAFAWERARYPFAHNRDLLRFSLKTAAQGRQAGRPLNLVLLLDNSGSMERADRVRIIQECLLVLARQLQPQDKLSVVTFARTARLWIDGLTGAAALKELAKVGELTPQGGTNLEEAMKLGYATALRHYLAGGVNRVVLLTDGAANLGDVKPESLKARVEQNRKQGIALDCFGIGWEGYNDDLLEVLTRNGDGRYGFVNTPEAAGSEFAAQLAGALHVAASDVKVQVEFNPGRVTSYRQIGYAKHQLTKEQFRDNTVDAAEIAAQEAGNALYVIETNPQGQGPIATVRVRYKVPSTGQIYEHEWPVPYLGSATPVEQASPALRLALTASAFSEWLAGSPFAGEVTLDSLLSTLRGVPEIYGADPRPKKLEWMIRQAKSISGK